MGWGAFGVSGLAVVALFLPSEGLFLGVLGGCPVYFHNPLIFEVRLW